MPINFQNPWGALALLLLVPLVLLYLLRQRHRELTVPSIQLWNQVLAQWQAAHPWQKWRNNLIFFLQLAAVCLLALALMRPVWRQAGAGQNNVIVLDVSMSMQAEEEGETRLGRAKATIRGLIGAMRGDEKVSLILSGQRNELLIGNTADKQAALNLLQAVEAWHGGGDLQAALGIAEALAEAEANTVVHLFTDSADIPGGAQVAVHNLALGADNVAMQSVNYAFDSAGRLSALGLLHNFGAERAVTVELWGDGTLLDVREVLLGADSAGNVLFENLTPTLQNLSMHIEDDALPADNTAWCVVQDTTKYKVLLQTERNIFLEQAILLRDDIELYKTTPAEATDLGGYALLIADGFAGATLPENQNLWLIGPQADTPWFTPQPAEEGAVTIAGTAAAKALFQYVDLSALQVAAASGLAVHDAETAILAYIGDAPLMILREEAAQKRLAFGFDFHDSNLPMQKDFPILVQNILAWFLPQKEVLANQITTGSAAPIVMEADMAAYTVRLPDGTLLENQTERPFEQTAQPGFYTLTQYDAAGEAVAEQAFAVNVAPLQESELRTAGAAAAGPGGPADSWRVFNLWPWLILCVLLLMALEWWVYYRGV